MKPVHKVIYRHIQEGPRRQDSDWVCVGHRPRKRFRRVIGQIFWAKQGVWIVRGPMQIFSQYSKLVYTALKGILDMQNNTFDYVGWWRKWLNGYWDSRRMILESTWFTCSAVYTTWRPETWGRCRWSLRKVRNDTGGYWVQGFNRRYLLSSFSNVQHFNKMKRTHFTKLFFTGLGLLFSAVHLPSLF